MHLSGRFAAVLGRLVHLVLLTLQFSRKGETKTSGQSWVRNELPCPGNRLKTQRIDGNRLKTQRIDSLEVLPESGMSFMWVFSIVSEELGPALTLTEEFCSPSAVHVALLGSGTNWQHFTVLL